MLEQSKSDINNNVEQILISVQDVIIEWQQTLLARTKKNIEDDDYLSLATLESYSRNLRLYVSPYLEKLICLYKNLGDFFNLDLKILSKL